MPISGQGWEFFVQRLAMHHFEGEVRTYGSYQVFLNGNAAPPRNGIPLSGFVCEVKGPGDNSVQGKHDHVRIAEGRYPLTTQFGDRYASMGYSTDTHSAAELKMPGVCLTDTGARSAILIHPGHPPNPGDPPFAYVASIGCLNLTQALQPSDNINFWESRARVIALIDSLAEFRPNAFRDAQGHPIMTNTPIIGAAVVVDGEPVDDDQQQQQDDTPVVTNFDHGSASNA